MPYATPEEVEALTVLLLPQGQTPRTAERRTRRLAEEKARAVLLRRWCLDPARPAGQPLPEESEEEVAALAKEIYEGGWMLMGGEWRWDRATASQRRSAYEKAHLLLTEGYRRPSDWRE